MRLIHAAYAAGRGRLDGGRTLKKYECVLGGWVYDEAKGDPEHGVAPGTKWEDLPEDFVCPLCGAGKEDFTETA